MTHEICPKCGLATIERYPNDKFLARCLNRECNYKEKLSDKSHCVVCFGGVVDSKEGGYYCQDCGIKYQFKPTEKIIREIGRRNAKM